MRESSEFDPLVSAAVLMRRGAFPLAVLISRPEFAL